MAEYRLSPAAERDLELIWTYTVRQWGVEQADLYVHPARLSPVGC